MNPILPLDEYIPDGEAHVFGSRVYLYGSHDKANSSRFCTEDYKVYSASIYDLEKWESKGVSYSKSQDPQSKENSLVDMYAPDCTRGNDGRYYLYYFASGPNAETFGPLSVAVSDSPDGPFDYLHDIVAEDGKPVLTYLTNDPAVINDNGTIYLYYGWGLGRDFSSKFLKPLYDYVLSKLGNRKLSTVKNTKPSILSCAVCTLSNDMYTIKEGPKAVLDSKTTAPKGSRLYLHPFYEAPSVRKFNDIYYLIYSSGENNELSYAVSKYPDRDFKYEGVLISNSDLGYNGNKIRKAPSGTIHGSVEYINGQYYVFYHRCTNNTDFSRQACMEKIEMENGKFKMAEITSSGISEPFKCEGEYSAALCCNLYNKHTKNVMGYGKGDKQTNISFRNNEHYVRAITNNTVVGFKYFTFPSPRTIQIKLRGEKGRVRVLFDNEEVGNTTFNQSKEWNEYKIKINKTIERCSLYFVFETKGKVDFLSFSFIN